MKKLIIIALLFVPMSAYAWEHGQQGDLGLQGLQGEQGEQDVRGEQGPRGVVNYFKVDHFISLRAASTLKSAKRFTTHSVNALATKDAGTFVTQNLHANQLQSKNITAATMRTGTLQAGGVNAYQVQSKAAYIGTGHIGGMTLAGGQISGVGNSTVASNAANVGEVKSALASANKTSANGDAITLTAANHFSTAGDKSTLTYANQDSQIMANAAQSNSESYTNQSYQQANTNAQGYAQQAQSNAETFAQGAANQAQINSEQYAASGIAAALAMPSSPYLHPGHYAVGIQAATYGGEQGFGARATFQINDHWSANAGVAGGTGIYGQVGGTVGVQFEG